MSYSQQDFTELIILAELAGVNTVPGVYKILVELLSLHVSPEDIYVLLRQISPLPQQRKRVISTSAQNFKDNHNEKL